MYDVIIIGAGVSGAASARELSKYKLKKKTSAAGLPRPTALLHMQVLTLRAVL